MKICEVCGTKEEMENNGEETIVSIILHVCESCMEDRKWHIIEN
ncbi:hypothetical protein [Neobacillus ginsengisoli]|uniref:Ribosome-binding protein aMBF1 (Putative translation factor) n=1 Tax=Neobacillus ginsengisoli TaxID=904295 RepID=A0ABT9Y3D3_9BACI|nr:hypothetical protein [Neobacillus ginsengisoli]MDQ0202051.1 ribosome-binding protein aMBF1 (putative translation factor) [Neobacillus ginsengisoli]